MQRPVGPGAEVKAQNGLEALATGEANNVSLHFHNVPGPWHVARLHDRDGMPGERRRAIFRA